MLQLSWAGSEQAFILHMMCGNVPVSCWTTTQYQVPPQIHGCGPETVCPKPSQADERMAHSCRRARNGKFRRGILIPSGGTTLINHAYATISVRDHTPAQS